MLVDSVGLIEHLGIDYHPSGKNVASNDINICCPFCGEDGYHLGVNKDNGQINCWVCGFDYQDRYPSLITLVMTLNDCSFLDAKSIVDEFKLDDFGDLDDNKNRLVERKNILMPKECEDFFKTKHKRWASKALDYLHSRGFDESTVRKYKLKFCIHGKYKYRIMIPITFLGKVVNFTGRDFTNRGVNRYKHCKNDFSAMRQKSLLYGLDNFIDCGKSHIRIFEGPTDVWRIGDTAVGLMRNRISDRQLSILSVLGLESASVILDFGSYSKAVAIAEELSVFVRRVKAVELVGKKDVADMSADEVFNLESTFDWMVF